MNSIRIHSFGDSTSSIVKILDEEGLQWSETMPPLNVPMAGPSVIEVLLGIGATGGLGSLAAVLVAFIKAKHGRKVMITTRDNTVIHAEGLSAEELETILDKTAWIAIADHNRKEDRSDSH